MAKFPQLHDLVQMATLASEHSLRTNSRMPLSLSAAALRIARRLRIQVPKRERDAAAELDAKLAATRRARRAKPAAPPQPKPEPKRGQAPFESQAFLELLDLAAKWERKRDAEVAKRGRAKPVAPSQPKPEPKRAAKRIKALPLEMKTPPTSWSVLEAALHGRAGWQRIGREWHGPCPVLGIGQHTCWFAPGDRTSVRGGCRKCGGRLSPSAFREHLAAIGAVALWEGGLVDRTALALPEPKRLPKPKSKRSPPSPRWFSPDPLGPVGDRNVALLGE